MFKDNLYLKFVRFFYNLTDDLDEYRENQLNKFGNNMFMFLYSMIWITFILGAFTIDISGLTLILMIFVPPIKIDGLVKKLGLDKIEVERKDLGVARQKMFKRTLWRTFITFVFNFIAMIGFWNSKIPQKDYSFNLYFYTAMPIILTLFTLIAFISYYISNRRRIKIIEE